LTRSSEATCFWKEPAIKARLSKVVAQGLESFRIPEIVWFFRFLIGHGKKATQGCPCGFFTDPQHECSCSPMMVQRYRSRISGPLLEPHRYPYRSARGEVQGTDRPQGGRGFFNDPRLN
jgi:hypothetical protein